MTYNTLNPTLIMKQTKEENFDRETRMMSNQDTLQN